MVFWWLCWHRTNLMDNIQKQHSQFPYVHDFGKPWWGVAYLPYVTYLQALCVWVIRWQLTGMLSMAQHWHSRRALSNHVCAHSAISIWHMICLQHLARACSEQTRSTTVLPINHVIQMPQCLSGFVNHDSCCLRDISIGFVDYHTKLCMLQGSLELRDTARFTALSINFKNVCAIWLRIEISKAHQQRIPPVPKGNTVYNCTTPSYFIVQ